MIEPIPARDRVAMEVRGQLARQRIPVAEAAAWLGISPAQLSRKLNNRAPFTINETSTLAERLGVAIAALYGETPR